MKITEITISYEATQSLADYSNVRPGVRLTATLAEDDDYVIARQSLLCEARAVVYDEIDRCLIADGKAPRYYCGPRYQVLYMYNTDSCVVVILPNEVKAGALPDSEIHVWHREGPRGMRLDQARQVAQEFADERGFTLMDCSNGDLSLLTESIKSSESAPIQPGGDEIFEDF